MIFLNEINLIDEEFYLKLKYGTINKKVISLVNDGFSRSLSELIISKYNNYFTLSESGDITLSKKIIKAMMNNNESEILMLETKLNIGE